MRLIFGQLLIKARWRDASLVLRDFRQKNKQNMRFQLALNKTAAQLHHPSPTDNQSTPKEQNLTN